MASVTYGPGIVRCYTDAGDDFGSGGSTLKMILLEGTTSTPSNPDHDFVDDISADEFSDTGYTGGFGGAGRQTLDSQTFTYDAANNRAELDFANETWTSLGGTNSVIGSVLTIEITNDAASPVFFFWDIADVVTNGQDFTLTVGGEGAVHFS